MPKDSETEKNETEILSAAKEIWEADKLANKSVLARVALDGKFFAQFHCGTTMVRVKNYIESSRPCFVRQAVDTAVCPVCLSGYVMVPIPW